MLASKEVNRSEIAVILSDCCPEGAVLERICRRCPSNKEIAASSVCLVKDQNRNVKN